MTPADEEEIRTVTLDPRAPYRVAVLISVALTILGFISFLLTGGLSEIFERTVAIRTFLPDGTGLVNKANVELNGIEVGAVTSVRLSGSTEPGRAVVVNLAINQKYLSAIPVDSRTEVTADNLLGDKYINIKKGVSKETVTSGAELELQPPSTNFDPADLIASLQVSLNRAKATLDQIDDPTTTIGNLIRGDDIYNKLRDNIASLQQKIHSYGTPKNAIGKALFRSELYEQLRTPILDIDKRLESIQKGEGELGHAFTSSEQYDHLRDTIAGYHASIADFRNNQFLASDDAYKNLLVSLKHLNAVIDSINASEYVSSAQFYEALNGSSKSARDFLSEFRKNPQKFLRLKLF